MDSTVFLTYSLELCVLQNKCWYFLSEDIQLKNLFLKLRDERNRTELFLAGGSVQNNLTHFN